MKKTISYNEFVPRAGEVYHYKADPCSLDYRPSMMKYYLYKYELCLISGRTVYEECLNLKTLDFGQMEFKSMTLKTFQH